MLTPINARTAIGQVLRELQLTQRLFIRYKRSLPFIKALCQNLLEDKG